MEGINTSKRVGENLLYTVFSVVSNNTEGQLKMTIKKQVQKKSNDCYKILSNSPEGHLKMTLKKIQVLV